MQAKLPWERARRTIDQHGLDEAVVAMTPSKDPSTQVGAYICDTEGRPVSKGRNGLPRGVNDDDPRLHDREWKYPRTIHAEANAIFFADRHRLKGSTMYVTHMPCVPCASAIIQNGITRVVCPAPSEQFASRWGSDGVEWLRGAGVVVDILGLDEWTPFGIDYARFGGCNCGNCETEGSDYC